MTSQQLSKLRSVEVRKVSPDDPPLFAFILMEAEEASVLVEKVTMSLTNMQRVVDGTGLSTPDIVNESRFLARNEVPPKWLATWKSGPEDPAMYLQGLSK